MAEKNRDELADALARLAGGEIAPSEVLPPAPLKQMRAASPSLRPLMPGSAEAPETVEPEDMTPVDDDWVMAPVSEEERALSPIKSVEQPRKAVARGALYQTLRFRQTIIPVLLTCGVLTLAFASLKFVMGPDSPFADLPGWVSGALIGAGLLLLVLAIINMLAVRHQMSGAGGNSRSGH